MPFRPISEEQYVAADKIVNDGNSVAEAARQTGISAQTLRKRYKSDPKPGGKRSTPKPKKAAATDEQLSNLFAKVAVAPAIPAALVLHCEFCADHFARTGPDAAAKLVELSRDHPALRNVMEGLWRYADEVAWAGVLGTWLGIPLVHHAAPDFIYRWLSMPLNMPPRGQPMPGAPPTNGHVHTDGPVPPPEDMPLASMDTETLAHMARTMGIDIDFTKPTAAPADPTITLDPDAVTLDVDDADTPAPAEGFTDDTETVEAVATDSDGS